MTYATRRHLQAGAAAMGNSLPYMHGWFRNTQFLSMMNTIGLPHDAVIECLCAADFGGKDQRRQPMPLVGWVMVANEQNMAIIHNTVVLFHMDADRGGASFYLPVHEHRWTLDIGDEAKLKPCARWPNPPQAADTYGWVECARMACVEDTVFGEVVQ